MRPLEWHQALLERHGLQQPDHRPLYQYRITDKEFSDLEGLLKLSAPLGFRHLVTMLKWDVAFVMYAAEWWRRYYDGKWSWDGIFNSLAIPLDDVSTTERNSLVELGLMRWGRSVRILHGRRRFLGTIATEGGLPLNRLKEAGGWLNAVLRPVLRKHIARGRDVSALLEGYRDRIPQSFQAAEVLQILEDLVVSVAEVRKTHKLDDQSDPVAWLDKNDPDWRERFPLPIESEVATTLIVDLIKEASLAREFSESDPDALFWLERYIINESTQPQLKAKLEPPAFLPLEFFSANEIDVNKARYDIDIVSDAGGRQFWGRAVKAAKGSTLGFRFTGRTLFLPDELALSELTLDVKSGGEHLGFLPLMSAYRLDLNEPWLFVRNGDRFELQGISTQKTKKENALVYIPSELTVQLDEKANLLTLKKFNKGFLYELSGKVACVNDEMDLSYNLQTGVAESYLQYELQGKEFARASKPGNVFIGPINVLERNSITGTSNRMTRHRISAKLSGQRGAWGVLSGDSFGVYELKVADEDGMTLSRRRVGALPSSFHWDLEVDRSNPRSGSIILHGLPNLDIRLEQHGIDFTHIYDEVSRIHTVKVVAAETQPISLRLDLLRIGDNRSITLDLPFPSAGVRLFDADGRMVARGASLFLNSFHGHRIRIFCEHGIHATYANLRIDLIDSSLDSSQSRDLFINKKLRLSAPVTEFALIDFLDDCRSLLGASTNLDASVRINIDLNGRSELNHQVHRYDCELIRDSSAGRISLPSSTTSDLAIDDQGSINIGAVLLNHPEANVQGPRKICSEGVFLGDWEFESFGRKAGLWLLYPEEDSKVYFRPMLWPIRGPVGRQDPEDVEQIESLPRAVWIGDPDARLEAIRTVLRQMTFKFDHSGWSYLKSLSDKCSHLPLSAFDVWTVAVTEPLFMACLVTHSELSDVVDKMVEELPVLWELVSFSDWESAIEIYQSFHHALYSGGAGPIDEGVVTVVRELIKSNILERIEDLSPALQSTRKILESRFLRLDYPEFRAFHLPYEHFLKAQVEALKRDLVTRNTESDWPIMLQDLLEKQAASLPREICSDLLGYRGFQTSVMLLPAVLALRQMGEKDSLWIGDTLTVFKLQQIKDFDSEWFEALFNLTAAWFYCRREDI